MEEGYCLSKLCRGVVICCNSVVRDIFVLSSDLMSFQIERWRITMARAGDHGYWRQNFVIMRSAFSIP